MDTLGAYGSDSDSSSSGSDKRDEKSRPASAGANDTAQTKPPSKRPRPESSTYPEPQTELLTPSRLTTLPKPTISNDSLVLWPTDYLTEFAAAQHPKKKSAGGDVKDSALYKASVTLTLPDNQSRNAYAEQLRTHHEFHNPCQFQNVADKLGIFDASSSDHSQANNKNLLSAWNEKLEDWECNPLELAQRNQKALELQQHRSK